jgi:hypothetical protein
VFDIALFADICIKISSAYTKGTKVIDERTKIIENSIKRGLIIDIICVVPWYAVYDQLMWFRVLRLLQCGDIKSALEESVINI